MGRAAGFSLLEMMLVLTIIGIIATLTLPNLLQTGIVARESAALSGVKGLVTAQISYTVNKGYGKYATDLSALKAAGLIDDVIATGTKGGYTFWVSGDGTLFEAGARPQVFGDTGTRSYYADASGVIRFTREDRPATSADTPVGQ